MAEPRRRATTVPLPIANLVTILLPAGVMAGAFLWSSVGQGPAQASAPPVPVDLQVPEGLAVVIGDGGYLVVWTDGPDDRWGLPVPCVQARCATSASYDEDRLVEVLGLVKDAHPHEDHMTLVPGPDTPYATIVATLDAARATERADGVVRELFPFAVVSAHR